MFYGKQFAGKSSILQLFCKTVWTFETRYIRDTSYESLHKHEILHWYSSISYIMASMQILILYFTVVIYLYWVLNIKSLFQTEHPFFDIISIRVFEWLIQNCRRARHVFPLDHSLAVYNTCKQRAQARAVAKGTWNCY